MPNPAYFFELEGQEAGPLFSGLDRVWEALPRIKDFIKNNLVSSVVDIRRQEVLVSRTHVIHEGEIFSEDLTIRPGDAAKGTYQVFHQDRELPGAAIVYAGAILMDDDIQLGRGAVIEPGALIKGPTIIGDNSEVRQGAYLRGGCLIGRACVVGHATEVKNSVFLDRAAAGHFAYIGDSILGADVNLGAGTKLANLKFIPGPIKFRVEGELFEASIRKFGAILGDRVQTGCNSVTSPGTLLGPDSVLSPNLTAPAGFYPQKTVLRPGK